MMRSSARPVKRLRTRGQALVEFAFIVPVFFLVAVILFDFGHVVYTQHTLAQVAREAARFGSLDTGALKTPTDWANRYQDIRDAARSHFVASLGAVPLTDADIKGASGDCTDPSIPPDVTAPGTCFYPEGSQSAGLDPGKVHVEITVTVPFTTPLIGDLLGGSYTIVVVAESVIQS